MLTGCISIGGKIVLSDPPEGYLLPDGFVQIAYEPDNFGIAVDGPGIPGSSHPDFSVYGKKVDGHTIYAAYGEKYRLLRPDDLLEAGLYEVNIKTDVSYYGVITYKVERIGKTTLSV